MPQRNDSPRFGQACPAGLSIAKSDERANAGATQHNPKHREQSARSSGSMLRSNQSGLGATGAACAPYRRAWARACGGTAAG
ncbi:hypothetical protein GCM10022255_064650 [Dactylosporangium darangshiense]|uniref:Uncharacterized protein n=1 Tax=Dactylosporangium darangshiense TaxID=579108 RepID=A0ABP8DGN6_9ACTN